MAIISTGHDVADARLHRTVAALRRAGANVQVRGLGDASRAPEGCTVTTSPPAGKIRRGLRALAWPWLSRADVVMTIDPDTALAAYLAARARRVIWVADVHEDYQALLKDRSWVPRPLLSALRGAVGLLNRLIAHADLVVVADDHIPPPRAARRVIMRNEPDFSLLPAVREHRGEGPWRAVHIGDNRTSRGLRTMVEAVAATINDANPWHLDIVGPVASGDRAWFDERLSKPDTRHIVHHGRLAPAKAWSVAATADVGLCLLTSTPAFVDSMPSKVYEYLGCGLPAVATPLPRVVELLHRTGAGVIVDGVGETAGALRRFATDPAWRESLVAASVEAAQAARERRNTYDATAAGIISLIGGGSAPRADKL
ncbi:MAG: glycosyltransferase [Propionibacteriaceae bacterium]|nr:glycosyltransferase [Propionibacteriaceae bacterium]